MLQLITDRNPADWLQEPLFDTKSQVGFLVIESNGSCRAHGILKLLGGASTLSMNSRSIEETAMNPARAEAQTLRQRLPDDCILTP